SGRPAVCRGVPPACGGAGAGVRLGAGRSDAARLPRRTEGNETEIVEGDLAEIAACDVMLAAFTAPDEGTAMEAWYAHALGKRVIAYTGGTPIHPWAAYVSVEVRADLGEAIGALAQALNLAPS